MQATIKGTTFGFGPIKHGIAALAIAATVVTGAAVVNTLGHADSGVQQQAAVVSTYSQADHQRFIEQNTFMPEAARLTPATNFRFLEMNMLPGDAVAPSVVSYAQMLFLERNLLPETAPVVKSAAEIRLWEQNILPGDDAADLAPFSRNGETTY